MNFSFKKLLVGMVVASLLVIGAHFGIIGALIAVCLVLQASSIWAFIHGLNSTPKVSNSRPLNPSAQVALRERAHLKTSEYKRLRALCEGEPRLQELMGFPTRKGAPIQEEK